MPTYVIAQWAILYRSTNSLSSIPGPLWSTWTDLPVRLQLLYGVKAKYVHSLHEKYGEREERHEKPLRCRYKLIFLSHIGPVVRIGPSEVDISDVSAVREIHAARSGFLKHPGFYIGGNVRSVFSALEPSFHAQRRRLLGPCFADSALGVLEPTVVERARLCISKMGEDVRSQGHTDILHWWTLFAMDVISEMCFGESFHMLEVGKVSWVWY